jgi:hypothetical protein
MGIFGASHRPLKEKSTHSRGPPGRSSVAVLSSRNIYRWRNSKNPSQPYIKLAPPLETKSPPDARFHFVNLRNGCSEFAGLSFIWLLRKKEMAGPTRIAFLKSKAGIPRPKRGKFFISESSMNAHAGIVARDGIAAN